MHSLISLDLGNAEAPNLLLNDDDLRYILDAPDDRARQEGSSLTDPELPGFDLFAKIPPPVDAAESNERVLLNRSFDAFAGKMGQLYATNATIYSQYACSVPVRKSTGTMLVSVLIANLVFLQAAWRILCLVADGMVTKQDPTAMHCDGCLRGMYHGLVMENLPQNDVTERRSEAVKTESAEQLIEADR